MATNTFTSTQRIILHINNFDELCFFCGPCPCHEQETPRLVKSQHSALDVSCFHVDYFIEYIKRRYRVSGSGVALVLTNSIRHPNRVTTLTSLCQHRHNNTKQLGVPNRERGVQFYDKAINSSIFTRQLAKVHCLAVKRKIFFLVPACGLPYCNLTSNQPLCSALQYKNKSDFSPAAEINCTGKICDCIYLHTLHGCSCGELKPNKLDSFLMLLACHLHSERWRTLTAELQWSIYARSSFVFYGLCFSTLWSWT